MLPGECRIVVRAMDKEEIQQNDEKKTTTEPSQATTSKAQTNEVPDFEDPFWVTDEQLLSELMAGKGTDTKNTETPIKIQRVPEIMLRNKDFKEFYTPLELSIGPIHAADPKLFKREFKVRLAAKFVKDSGLEAKDLLQEIKKNIQVLKKSFKEEVIILSDENFARLLFLDGCAVLEFIFGYVNNSLNMLEINNGQADLIRQDLFLLENQIPFKLLKLLIDFSKQSPGKRADLLLRFVLLNNVIAAPVNSEYLLSNRDLYKVENLFFRKEEDPVHLLDLLRSVLLFDPCEDDLIDNFLKWLSNVCSCNCLEDICSISFRSLIAKIFCAPRDFISRIIIRRLFGQPRDWNKDQSFRNVRELKAAGIKLKSSNSCSLKAISFRTRCFFRGHLKLPSLIVDVSTPRKLLNLVAYEMCRPDYENNCVVTSYISFLDLLIDDEDDVKNLRAAGIIRNRLSTDIQVAAMFNSIGSNCLAPPQDAYSGVKNKLEKHYKRKFTIWMAQVYHSHFKSPWTILALFAAITVLALTAVQTWYAIQPQN